MIPFSILKDSKWCDMVILLFYLRLAKYLTMIIEAFLQMMKKKSQ